jgi:hypothetical protein
MTPIEKKTLAAMSADTVASIAMALAHAFNVSHGYAPRATRHQSEETAVIAAMIGRTSSWPRCGRG